MIWDRENQNWTEELPANRFRVEFGLRIAGTTQADWENDSIGNSEIQSKDYASKTYAIKRAERLLGRADVSFCTVFEIAPSLTDYDITAYEWQKPEDGYNWN